MVQGKLFKESDIYLDGSTLAARFSSVCRNFVHEGRRVDAVANAAALTYGRLAQAQGMATLGTVAVVHSPKPHREYWLTFI
jgi:hypothetical protein